MKNLLRKSLFRVSVLFVYALFGGGLFYCIEKIPEDSKDVYLRLSRELQTNFTNKFNVSMNEEDFKRFIYRAFEVVGVRRNADWNFLRSLSFTLTTLATVGYGHITPETPLGQIATVVYSFLGIPLTMLVLKTMGEMVSKLVNHLIYAIEAKLLCRKRPGNVKMKSVFVTFALVILTICLGGLEGIYLEGWTFVEGFYAWFATLSTVGYGDYVPRWSLLLQAEESSNPKSKLGLGLIMFISALPSMAALCAVAGLLNALAETVDELKIKSNARNLFLGHHERKIGIGRTCINETISNRRERSATF
ncbi:potassium channel subfamily K member 3-like [Stylophora pistillata]|uniref:potassium channel subfamily K member 3-like n=1 Tax=Stylophora pistillata TaxID=50429 RepID=UPI000C04ED4E|nr:potassium channel subfamily K member 3-like [Stylophora pistillata]